MWWFRCVYARGESGMEVVLGLVFLDGDYYYEYVDVSLCGTSELYNVMISWLGRHGGRDEVRGGVGG